MPYDTFSPPMLVFGFGHGETGFSSNQAHSRLARPVGLTNDSIRGKGSGNRQKRSVAIVEDEEEALRAYSMYLRKRGYDSVFTFVNGEEFVRAVRDDRLAPDLVLVDYRLPGENGIETAKGVAEMRPGIKVIVTTADDSVLGKAESLGFHFLQKPFSLAALASLMDGV